MRLAALLLFAASAFAADIAKVDAIFAEYTRPNTPGCAVGVLQNGQTVLAKGYGLADLDHQLAITPKTRFYMGSVSKQITSMAVLHAEQEGLLKLSDSIRKYIPELPPYFNGITIARLLDHTAGVRDYLALWGLRGWSNESVLRESATFALIARQQATDFVPGTDYSYSNSGYFLAVTALQRVTGMTLDAYAQRKLFQPLEMSSTWFQHDHGRPVPDRAYGYAAGKTANLGFDIAGSGGLYSNIEDMLKWARGFETPNPLSTRLQTVGTLNDGRPTPTGYALGVRNVDGVISHGGAAPGYTTFLLRIPAKKLAVLTLCNQGGAPTERLAQQVAVEYTGQPAPPVIIRDPAPPGPPVTKAEAAELAGLYFSPELQTTWQFAWQSGKLVLLFDGPVTDVRKGRKDSFTVGGATITLRRDAAGKVTGFDASAGRAKGIRFNPAA